MKKLLSLLAVVLFASTAFSQTVEDYMQLVKADLDAERKAIIIENMEFSDSESKAFWPIYNQYRDERSELGEAKLAMYKDYIDNYENLNSEKGAELIDQYFKLNRALLDLEQDYATKLTGALNAQRAVQFFQIENRINILIQLEIMAALPISVPTEEVAPSDE